MDKKLINFFLRLCTKPKLFKIEIEIQIEIGSESNRGAKLN
jgi:hypothetical protein